MLKTRVIESPYMTQEEAAAYVKRSDRTFRGYVAKYKIPRYGPGRNLYLAGDLQMFMENPHCFMTKKPLTPSRSFGFTPVSV